MFDPIAYINEPRWQKVSLGLSRIELLLELLGNPQNQLKFVHVAGTNGKGSVCAYLEAILRENGQKTGLFTSPYIDHFEERIRVNNEDIDINNLTRITILVKEKALQVENQLGEHPTEFELMTAVAFVYFFQQKCDICVVEVGLGGRLDSTNVITPLLSVITKIGLDHTAILGDTLEKIAYEKAGIIKPGVRVVVDKQTEEARLAIEKVANETNSEIIYVDKASLRQGGLLMCCKQNEPVFSECDCEDVAFDHSHRRNYLTSSVEPFSSIDADRLSNLAHVRDSENNCNLQFVSETNKSCECNSYFHCSFNATRSFLYRNKSYYTQLLGAYQPENAAVAIEAAFALGIDESKIQAGIENATWPGRFELFSCGLPCLVFVDGAHNPDGAAALRDSLLDVTKALKNRVFCKQEQNLQIMSDLNNEELKIKSDLKNVDFQNMSDLKVDTADFDQKHKSDICLKNVKIIAVIGVLKDKDVRGILENVGDLIDEFYVYEPNNPRKLPADDLWALTFEYGVTHETSNARGALDAALKCAVHEATKKDTQSVIVCFGSLYSVGELRAHLKEFAS